MQAAAGESVDLAVVEQGYTGERPAKAAADHGILGGGEAKPGFVILMLH